MFEIMFFALLMFGFLILLCTLYKVAEYICMDGNKPEMKHGKSKRKSA